MTSQKRRVSILKENEEQDKDNLERQELVAKMNKYLANPVSCSVEVAEEAQEAAEKILSRYGKHRGWR